MIDRLILAALLILPLLVTVLSLSHGYAFVAVWGAGVFGFVLCGVVGMIRWPAVRKGPAK